MIAKVYDLPAHLHSALRWIALTFTVIAFASLCFWILAPWQLGKNARTEMYNKTVQQALTIPAMPLAQVNHGIPDTAHIWRLVTFSGHFIPTPVTTERLRIINGQPAIKFLTAFHTDSGRNIIIYRGYQEDDQPNPTPLPTGKVLLTARMHVNEGLIPGKEGAITTPQGLQVYAINSQILSRIWKLHLEPGYFALDNNSPGILLADPLPELKTGPYLSYGIQWIAFGILAPIGLIYLIYQERKNRQQLKEHKVVISSSETTDIVSGPEVISDRTSQHPHQRLVKKAYKKQLLTQLRGNNNENHKKLLDTSIDHENLGGTGVNAINLPEETHTNNDISHHRQYSDEAADISKIQPQIQHSATNPLLIDKTEKLLRDRYGKKS